MERLTIAGLAATASCTALGVTLWAWGLISGSGESNALTEMGAGLIGAAVVALAILSIERGLETSARKAEQQRDDRQTERDAATRADERRREVRLLIALQPSLSGADLSEYSFDRMHLAGKDFSNSVLSGCSFTGANLQGVRLQSSEASDTDFSNARLRAADLRAFRAENCNFAHADLTNAILVGARLGHCDLRGALFTEIDAHSADFYGSDLADADLTGADLSSAGGLFADKLRGARCDDRTRWPERINPDDAPHLRRYRTIVGTIQPMTSRDLRDVNFTPSRFERGEYRDVDFTGSWLRGIDFYQSTFIACDFSRADLVLSAGLLGAHFTDCVYDVDTEWPETLFDPTAHEGLTLIQHPD